MSEILSLLEMYVMPVIRPALELADTVPGWGACLLMLLFFGLSILFGMIHGAFASKEKARSIEIRGFMICLCGALTYVLLYMLKTFIYQKFVYSFPMDAVWATMLSKLIPSLINAGVAVVAAPLFFHAVLPALKSTGLLNRMASGQ